MPVNANCVRKSSPSPGERSVPESSGILYLLSMRQQRSGLSAAPLSELRRDFLQQLLRQRAAAARLAQTGQSLWHLPCPPATAVFLQRHLNGTPSSSCCANTEHAWTSPPGRVCLLLHGINQPHVKDGCWNISNTDRHKNTRLPSLYLCRTYTNDLKEKVGATVTYVEIR